MIASVLTDDLKLVGRDAETKLLDTVLGRLGDSGGALVFRGEPGIGKSALLDRARQRARAMGARVLSTVGVESEAELAFAGLHQLLHPIVGLMDRLSDSQRAALEAAFGVTADLEPDLGRLGSQRNGSTDGGADRRLGRRRRVVDYGANRSMTQPSPAWR